MSLRPEIRTRARGDTVRQYKWYCEHGGIEVADRFIGAIESEISRLCERPQLGVSCRFPGKSFRGYRYIPLAKPFQDFLLFYRFDATSLEVVRILHGARDIPYRLREQPAVYGAAAASTVEALA